MCRGESCQFAVKFFADKVPVFSYSGIFFLYVEGDALIHYCFSAHLLVPMYKTHFVG
jgi:hypothetical protein